MSSPSPAYRLPRSALDGLLQALKRHGYRTIGPVIREGAIVYDELDSADDLPVGWTDVQEAGTYRLERRNDEAVFGYVVGPHSWKKYLFPPRSLLWRAQRTDDGFAVQQSEPPDHRPAFFGMRSCELRAIAIQDRVFLGGEHVDPTYSAVRERAFLVAVNCGQAGGTCFCVSMDTGPRVRDDYDLALTEILEGGHRFLLEVGSERGAEVAAELALEPAADEDREAAGRAVERAAQQMGRTMDVGGIRDLLVENAEHPRWDDVAQRCLSCANCTLVCPTCFCSEVTDTTDLTGDHAERWREWDSCFLLRHSYVHGGSVRPSVRSRYRQWLTHKLATWFDQFETSGCVGCGRCITWCPVGIDITAEVSAIREGKGQEAPA